MKGLRVIAADDSAVVRDCLKRVFRSIKGCKLVGLAGNGEEALSVIRRLRPDEVVFDWLERANRAQA